MRTPPGVHRDWLTRTWSFDFPSDLYPEVIERLRGTPLRLETTVAGLTLPVLTRRHAYDWSIQENAGHIADMDVLFNGRIDDFLSNADVLRPADMSNQATNDANHNARPLEEVLEQVRRSRQHLVDRLEGLAPGAYARTAYHERLDIQMRLVDQPGKTSPPGRGHPGYYARGGTGELWGHSQGWLCWCEAGDQPGLTTGPESHHLGSNAPSPRLRGGSRPRDTGNPTKVCEQGAGLGALEGFALRARLGPRESRLCSVISQGKEANRKRPAQQAGKGHCEPDSRRTYRTGNHDHHFESA